MQDADVQSYVNGTTYASKREKLRKLLDKNEISPEVVRGHAAQNQTHPIQDIRYGNQRRKVGLAKKNVKGKVIFGVEKEPRPKRTRGSIIINGEKLTAKQALHKYPRLREHLLKGRPNIKEATLHAKLRKAYKKQQGNLFEHAQDKTAWTRGNCVCLREI